MVSQGAETIIFSTLAFLALLAMLWGIIYFMLIKDLAISFAISLITDLMFFGAITVGITKVGLNINI